MSVGVERTAIGPTLVVAIDQHEDPPLIPDPWAQRILPRPWRIPLTLSRFGPVRRAMVAATEQSVPGGWASLLCRNRYLRPSGRDQPVSEIERAAFAERVS